MVIPVAKGIPDNNVDIEALHLHPSDQELQLMESANVTHIIHITNERLATQSLRASTAPVPR